MIKLNVRYTRRGGVLFICLAFLIVVVCSVNAQDHTVYEQKKQRQLLTETIHILGGFNNRVPRWSGEIRMALIGSLSEPVEANFTALVAQLSLYTGLSIRRIDYDLTDVPSYINAIARSPPHDLTLCSKSKPSECANLLIIVSDQSDMHKITKLLPMRPVYQRATALAERVHCFFSPAISRTMEIRQSVIFINRSLSQAMQYTCLQEEITQSLGLFNDYTGSVFYSFNNIVSPKKLTVRDKILLTSLYDRAFSTGTLAGTIAKQAIDYRATISD